MYVIIGTVAVALVSLALLVVSHTVYKRRRNTKQQHRQNSASRILRKEQKAETHHDAKVNINNNTTGQPKARKISSSLKEIKRKVSRQHEGI